MNVKRPNKPLENTAKLANTKQLTIAVNHVGYYLLCLKVTVLKVISLGFYAPWGNELQSRYLLENAHFGDKKISLSAAALNVFKVRSSFAIGLIMMFLLGQTFAVLAWFFHLLLLLSLPGFYLVEKKYRLNAIAIEERRLDFNLSLSQFYKAISLPAIIFVLFSALIFNSELIDSRFLASIETKQQSSPFVADSYLAKVEQALDKELGHELEHGHDHKDEAEIAHWSEDISQQEKDYLAEHEASHNHGSITLSSLEKYQLAKQGNQFIQYILLFLVFSILWPWFDFKLIAHRVNHTQLADTSWKMQQTVMSLYGLYIKAMLLVFMVIGLMGLVVAQLFIGSEGSRSEFWSDVLVNGLWLLPMGVLIFVLAISLVRTWRKQWLLEGLVSEQVETHSHTSYLGGLMLSLSNTVIVFFTLGLGSAYCQLRTYHYLSQHFNVRL